MEHIEKSGIALNLLTPLQQWEAVCHFFQKIRQDFPAPTAKQMIDAIEATPFWKSLEQQFGPCPN